MIDCTDVHIHQRGMGPDTWVDIGHCADISRSPGQPLATYIRTTATTSGVLASGLRQPGFLAL